MDAAAVALVLMFILLFFLLPAVIAFLGVAFVVKAVYEGFKAASGKTGSPSMREDVFNDPSKTVNRLFRGNAVFVRFEEFCLPDGFKDKLVVFDGCGRPAFMQGGVIFVSKSLWDSMNALERNLMLLHERYHVMQTSDKKMIPLYVFIVPFCGLVILTFVWTGMHAQLLLCIPPLVGMMSIAARWPVEFFAEYYTAKTLGREDYKRAWESIASKRGFFPKPNALERFLDIFIHPPRVFYIVFGRIMKAAAKDSTIESSDRKPTC